MITVIVIVAVIGLCIGIGVFKFRDEISGLIGKGKQKKEDLKQSAADLIKKV